MQVRFSPSARHTVPSGFQTRGHRSRQDQKSSCEASAPLTKQHLAMVQELANATAIYITTSWTVQR